jgi:hypothetical protein
MVMKERLIVAGENQHSAFSLQPRNDLADLTNSSEPLFG